MSEPEKPARTVTPPKRGVDLIFEDRSRPGWPGYQANPFVNPVYYEQFPKELRPRLDVGGGIAGSSVSIEQAQKIAARWTEPFPMITVVNMTEQDWTTHILGPDPDSVAEARVPPCGVLRGCLQGEVDAGMHGSHFHLRYPIAADAAARYAADYDDKSLAGKLVGDCDMEDPTHLTGKLSNGERVSSCFRYGCSRPGHFDKAKHAHSIKHAHLYIQSCGEALASPHDPEHEARYIPFLKEAEDKIMRFKKVDLRQPVWMYLTERMEYLRDREAKIKVAANAGKPMAGR